MHVVPCVVVDQVDQVEEELPVTISCAVQRMVQPALEV